MIYINTITFLFLQKVKPQTFKPKLFSYLSVSFNKVSTTWGWVAVISLNSHGNTRPVFKIADLIQLLRYDLGARNCLDTI